MGHWKLKIVGMICEKSECLFYVSLSLLMFEISSVPTDVISSEFCNFKMVLTHVIVYFYA